MISLNQYHIGEKYC